MGMVGLNRTDYLVDKQFLLQMDEYPIRVVYARIISLTFDEKPRGVLEGKVVSGSINVDGASAMRRTCTLQITCEEKEVNINDLNWALHTKFKVYIGLQNFVNTNIYPEIVWYPQGTFVMTQISQSLTTNGYTINITGKDKMCLLDGTIGGNVFAAHDFGKVYIYDHGMYTGEEDVDIRTIVKGIAHDYAGEPWGNIIIEDVDDVAVELLDNNAENVSIYIFNIYQLDETANNNSLSYDLSTQTTQIRYIKDEEYKDAINNTSNKPATEVIRSYSSLDKVLVYLKYHGYLDQIIYWNGAYYQLLVGAEYGETVGYRSTELTYPGELTLAVGDPVTKALDMIVKMLGEFEYFYDVNGKFHFRRKLIYSNISFTNEVITNPGEAQKEKYYAAASDISEYSYKFNNGNLIASFNNNPQVANIKNDFSIWGEQSTKWGTRKVHLRYAIDERPLKYFRLRRPGLGGTEDDGHWYVTDEYLKRLKDATAINPSAPWELDPELLNATENQLRVTNPVDWRDLIYFMAYDRQQKDKEIEYWTETFLGNDGAGTAAWLLAQEEIAKWEATETTGYKDYYADVLAFWPLVHNVDILPPVATDTKYQGAESAYQADLKEYQAWVNNEKWNPEAFNAIRVENEDGSFSTVINLLNPQNLLFWFDFPELQETVPVIGANDTAETIQQTLDKAAKASDLSAFNCRAIGHRPKMLSDQDVKAINYHSIPNVLFSQSDEAGITRTDDTKDYVELRYAEYMKDYFRMSARGKTCVDTLEGLLYTHTFFQESITIQCMPIYYLEPNTKIQVVDERTGINGDYIIKSFNYNLTHDGMMSIQATRCTADIL